MHIRGIDHINIRTRDLERLEAFYTGVLGLEVGDRPAFDSPGLWLYSGSRAIVHVSVAETPAEGDTQPLDHIAFATTGLAETKSRLAGAGVPFEEYQVPGRRMRQVFVTDPDGISLELNFSDPADVD